MLARMGDVDDVFVTCVVALVILLDTSSCGIIIGIKAQ
jgi:hypothetical protein